MTLPPVPTVAEIRRRLIQIFPEGTPNRGYCTREIAAKTVFVMLYIDAIERSGRFLRPDQVTRMTNSQAARKDHDSRLSWTTASLSKSGDIPGRWYAANTREPIRDETLREGLIPTGAAKSRTDLPTTSASPRYFLTVSFAALFDPGLKGKALKTRIADWQATSLSAGARARIRLVGRGAVAVHSGVLVTYPNGETRRLSAGPSSIISKAVIEDFAKRFLGQPAVILLSDSGNKMFARDESIAQLIGLAIPPDRYLPDILLVDLSPSEPLLVFIEVVATDGPINARRKEAFLEITARRVSTTSRSPS